MAYLRVKEIAEAQGINMSQLQRRSGVTMPSVRRYWYNTRDGKAEGPQIREIDLVVLEAIARVLGVTTAELIVDTGVTDEGNSVLLGIVTTRKVDLVYA